MRNFIIVTIFLILLWQCLYFVTNNDILIPQLHLIIKQFFLLLGNKLFLTSVFSTLFFLIKSWLVSSIIILFLILISLLNKDIKNLIKTICGILLTVPAFVWLPIFITLLGVKIISVYYLLIISTVTLSGHTCITAVESSRDRWGKHVENLRMNIFLSIKKVYVPSIANVLTSSLLSAWNLSWRILVSIEAVYGAIGGHWGVGTYLIQAKDFLQRDEMFAVLFYIIILSILFHKILFKILEKLKNIV
jgi:ABC-type nitrate/sulfonate/bicarbonate transport system permease component